MTWRQSQTPVEPENDYFLIWAADTLPLRPLRFFDEQRRMLLTRAAEHHAASFAKYRRLRGEEPNREFSFISQHILVQKSVAREMLEKIEQRIPGTGNWAWKIMRSLPASGDNLFSEYETYGHYVKSHYPDRITFVGRPWLREGTRRVGGGVPTADDLEQLAREFDFVAFERVATVWRRMARSLLRRVRNACG